MRLPHQRASQVANAITRKQKEEIVAHVKENLQGSVIVFGMRFKGLDVRGLGFGTCSV